MASFASPATAWEFIETTVCTVSHAGDDVEVAVVFDPSAALYTITLTLQQGTWPQSNAFRLRFDGPRALIIGTDRHSYSPDGRSLSVSDSGFDNVLDGIGLNQSMTALVADQSVSVATTDAKPAMDAFRACPSAPIS
jgi:hypothetical protein